MVISREAGRITYSTNIRERKLIPLDEYQKSVIVGTLLGDACLHVNWSKTNYRLQIRQSLAQKKYVEWKYKIFQPLVLTPPQYYKHTNSVWFRTISHPELTLWHKVFYRDGKKIVPENIEQLICDPVAMAVWFMDDGNKVSKQGRVVGYNLNTQSFSFEENTILKGALENIWGLRCSINANNGYFRLYIWLESCSEFKSIVAPHILSSLKYKIG